MMHIVIPMTTLYHQDSRLGPGEPTGEVQFTSRRHLSARGGGRGGARVRFSLSLHWYGLVRLSSGRQCLGGMERSEWNGKE